MTKQFKPLLAATVEKVEDIRGFKVPTWVLLLLFFVLFGVVGYIDFIDSVREEYQSKCNGTIDVEGDLVICSAENQSPKIIGVLSEQKETDH